MIRVEPIGTANVAFYEGPAIGIEAEATDVIGACYGHAVDVIALPVEKLADDFFWLSTGLAGAILQKFQQYGFRVAVLGDVSRFADVSPSLRDFIYESNKRGQTMFLPDSAALRARL